MNAVIESPLISVIVVTYKSAGTVLETLESIYRQSYSRIELIIADDKSPDNTVKVCEDWLKEHQNRFEGTKIIVPEKNTGTSGNCNRGCGIAHGEWLKIIAGDDLMMNDGLEKLYNHCVSNPEARIVCGTVEVFGVEMAGYDHMFWQHNLKLYSILDSVEEQYWYLLRRNFIAAMGVMMKKEIWEEVGGFDEEVPLIEDWPMWLKITETGNKIFFFPAVVAKYRLTASSVRSTNYLYAYNVQLLYYKWIYRNDKIFQRLKKMTFLKKRTLLGSLVYRYLRYDGTKRKNPW